MAAGRSMELFAIGLRTDGYTPELAGMEFYDSVDTAVAMGKRLGYRLTEGAPPKGLPTRRSGLEAVRTLIRCGEIKMISVKVKHYQEALESGVLKISSSSPPVSHCFQRQHGKPLTTMCQNGDFLVSDLKVTVSVLQGSASASYGVDESGSELVSVPAVDQRQQQHRLVYYSIMSSQTASCASVHEALFKNMVKTIPGLTDNASEHTVLFSDFAAAPLLAFCVSGGETQEMLLDRYVAEELPTRFKHVPVSASPLSGFWAVRASVSDLPSAGVELAGRLSTRVKVSVTSRQSRETTNDLVRERQMEQAMEEEIALLKSDRASLLRMMWESKRRRMEKEEEYRASEHNMSEEHQTSEHKVSEGQTAETQMSNTMIAGPGDDEMASQSAETQARPQ
ncbi:unnamed protein product, partial [Symbiodinium necroappetens]